MNNEDPLDWFLNYPPIELRQSFDKVNHIVFSDTSLKIPYIYNQTDSIYFDLNKDGTILETEYLLFPDYNIFGIKRLLIRLQTNNYSRTNISLIKHFTSEKIYQVVSDIYTGYFYGGKDSIMVGVFLSPNYYNYNKSPGLFIVINNNKDSVFDSDEIFPLQYVFQIKNKFYEFGKFKYQNDNISVIFTESNKRIGLNTGLYHPNFKFYDIKENAVHSLDEFVGSVTFINWWFTTCGPCVKKIPLLNNLKMNFPKVNFIAVNPIDSPSEMKAFLSNNNFNFNHYTTDEQTAISIGVKGMPHVVIVDEKQKIIYKGSGRIKDIKNILEKHSN